MTVRRKPKPGKPGPKPKAAGELRSKLVPIKVTGAEYTAIADAAASESQTVSDWGRAAFDLALARGSTR